jgi:hypothetical protein
LGQAGAQVLRAASREDQVDRSEIDLKLRREIGSWGGLAVAVEGGLGGAAYASGRHDGRISPRAEAELAPLGVLGFAPVLGLDYQRVNSNLLIHDNQSPGLQIRSHF